MSTKLIPHSKPNISGNEWTYIKVSGNCNIVSNNFFGTGCILFPNIMVNNSNVGTGAVVKRKKLIKQIVSIPKCITYDKR